MDKNIMKEKEYIDNLCDKFNIQRDKIKVFDRKKPHKIEVIPNNYMIVYIFKYNNYYLKIGKAYGKNRNKRPNNYHYRPNSSPSNLAKSIINDPKRKEYYGIFATENIKDWMLENLQRIDIWIDESLGVWTLNLIEVALQYEYRPRYEGRKDQNDNN